MAALQPPDRMIEISYIVTLLIIFQLKHFLADYPLQTPWMLGKFKEHDWTGPLAVHAGVHAGFTLIIAGICGAGTAACLMALFDFTVHFTMDRIKASPRLMGRWKALSANEMEQACHVVKLWTPYLGNPNYDQVELKKLLNDSNLAMSHNTRFWWALGFDQMVHHLTHYVIIAWIVLT